MSNWTNNEVLRWLKANGFKNYTQNFREQQIDGHRFLRLTDDEIPQLLTQSTLGDQIRFRTKLKRLKEKDVEAQKERSLTNLREVTENIPRNEENTHRSINAIRQYQYRIDQEKHLLIFRKANFVDALFNFIKKETISTINLELINNSRNGNDDFSPTTYTIQFNGKKSEIRTVRNRLRQLLESIQTKEYRHPLMKHWNRCPTANNIIQHFFDTQTSLWTICNFSGWSNPTLEILFFNDEKFNGISPIPLIDNIVEKQISMERFFIKNDPPTLLRIEHVDLSSLKVTWHDTLCSTHYYTGEYERIIQKYQQDNPSLISINEDKIRDRTVIDIFGYGKWVNKLLRELEDLFKKHRRRQYPFTQLSTTEIDCLFQLYHKELRQMEQERENEWVQFDLKKSCFYAPVYAQDKVESRLKTLFTQLQRQTFKTDEFYYDTHRQIESQIKIIAKNNRCYSIIKRKSKMKSFPMLQQSSVDTGNLPPSLIDSLQLSPNMIYQTKFPNGSIATSIGDITEQQVDIMVIPSFRSGLREHLIRCAGDITEINHSQSTSQQLSFITETTPGNLRCQKILFVDWSLPQQPVRVDSLNSSIHLFVSEIFQYLIKQEKTSTGTVQSIAMAMPETTHNEPNVSEEFLDELINQIHSIQSWSFQISLMFLPDQMKFYQAFNETLRHYHPTDCNYGIFYCPSTVLTVTLFSITKENIERVRKILNSYVQRSISTKLLNSVPDWNQSLISQFYVSAQQRSVLLRLNVEKREVTLCGPIVDVEQLYHEYQLIQLSLHTRRKYFEQLSSTNILLHYSSNDSIVGDRLFNHLTSDGFNVSLQFDSSRESLVVFCISDSALSDDQFRQRLIAAHGTGQRFIPIQIEPFRPTRWLRQLIEKQYVFRLFGSAQYVHLQYQKLILKIMFDGKQNNKDLLEIIKEDPKLMFLLSPEERAFIYQKQTKKMLKEEKNRFLAEERSKVVSLIHERIREPENFPRTYLCSFYGHDMSEQSDDHQRLNALLTKIEAQIQSSSLREWIDRSLRHSVKQNLPPFSPTGDFNDAPFISSTMVSADLSLAVLFGAQFWSFIDVDELTITKSNSAYKKKTFIYQPPAKKAKKPMVYSNISRNFSKKTTCSESDRTSRQKKQAESHDQSLKRSHIDIEARNARCQPMVERLKKGFEEFERLCIEYQPNNKKTIQQEIKAIFTVSPFNNAGVQHQKALQTRPHVDLPLKFLWNGVSEVEKRISKRNDTSVFFFYEPPALSENKQ